MESILFVDACMRGAAVSRTHQLCRHFLKGYLTHHPEAQVIHRDLCREPLPLLTGDLTVQREHWLEEEPDHPLLNPAREVAEADLILIGVPYWDLLFPAALKAYLAWASCRGITFRYTEEGQQIGLSPRPGLLHHRRRAGGRAELRLSLYQGPGRHVRHSGDPLRGGGGAGHLGQ